MITGLTLGIVAWASMIATFMHLPKRAKQFLATHFLITDALATGLTYTFLAGISKSIAAVLGSLTCGLLVNFTLMANKQLNDNGGIDVDAEPASN
jgi:hypothetical protein